MLGYPGAGKTTTAKLIQGLSGAELLSSDQVRLELFPNPKFTPAEHEAVYESIDEQTEQLLVQGKSVIYDANLNRYQHRKEKYEICAKVGAKPVLVWIKTPAELSKTRAIDQQRSHLWPQDETASEMFERLVTVFEAPASNESVIELDGTKITSEYVKQALEL